VPSEIADDRGMAEAEDGLPAQAGGCQVDCDGEREREAEDDGDAVVELDGCSSWCRSCRPT